MPVRVPAVTLEQRLCGASTESVVQLRGRQSTIDKRWLSSGLWLRGAFAELLASLGDGGFDRTSLGAYLHLCCRWLSFTGSLAGDTKLIGKGGKGT